MAPKHKPRHARFDELKAHLQTAHEEADALREELQGWRDNLPENLQSSTKADELDEATAALEEFCDYVQNALDMEVNFPKAF